MLGLYWYRRKCSRDGVYMYEMYEVLRGWQERGETEKIFNIIWSRFDSICISSSNSRSSIWRVSITQGFWGDNLRGKKEKRITQYSTKGR